MRLIQVGLASIDTTVGAMRRNTEAILSFARQMAKEDCTVGCFQEQVISGYPAEDLVQWKGFVDEQWRALMRIAEATRKFNTVFTLGLTVQEGGHLYNSVAVLYGGRVVGIVPKEKLPTYGVFYEERTFSRGVPYRVSEVNGVPFGDMIFRFPFGTVAVEVCEDIWTPDGPMKRRAYSGAELVVNASASPWRAGVLGTRRELISTRAADNLVSLVYVNQYGGNDALVFDGGGFVNNCGRMALEMERWQDGDDVAFIDLDRVRRLRNENTTWRTDAESFMREGKSVRVVESEGPGPVSPDHACFTLPPGGESLFHPSEEDESVSAQEAHFEDILNAMLVGLDGYFRKNGAFSCIGIALSGGKDSMLTLLIAYLYALKQAQILPTEEEIADYLKQTVHCISMPTRFNSETTKGLARRVAEKLGVTFREVSIEDAFAREVEAAKQMAGLGPDETLPGATVQNIQARIRGSRMWNWANASRGMWLQTGNMSEKAVGYTTVGGDLMGAYSLIGNLPKTEVIALLRCLADELELAVIREEIMELLATKASAELAEGQEDERDLMPFEVLDACYLLFAGEKLSPVELYFALRGRWTDDQLRVMDPTYEKGRLKQWVKKFCALFVGSIFKWVQAPQTVHLGTLDLDRERALQLPTVQSGEWMGLEELDALPD